MKLADLLSQFNDMVLFQSTRQSLPYPGWIVKNYPGIGFSLLITIGINMIILQKGFCQQVLKRVKQVVGQGMNNAVILLKMIIFPKVGKFRNNHIAVLESDAKNMVGG